MRPTPAAEHVDDWIRRASMGEADAWRSLVETYSHRVYGLIYKHCKNKELSEEITQDTFVKMVRALHKSDGYSEKGRFEGWLFRIAMNGLRDEMRRRKRQAVGQGMQESGDGPTTSAISQIADDHHQDPLERMTHEEQLDSLKQCMNQLSDADREVLYLRHTAGLSFQQIAESLGKPLGTVLARAHRAVGKLRKLMSQDRNEVDAA